MVNINITHFLTHFHAFPCPSMARRWGASRLDRRQTLESAFPTFLPFPFPAAFPAAHLHVANHDCERNISRAAFSRTSTVTEGKRRPLRIIPRRTTSPTASILSRPEYLTSLNPSLSRLSCKHPPTEIASDRRYSRFSRVIDN